MVHLIWKKRRPKLDELQKFKNLCYDVYLEFTISGKVDHNNFNNTIKQYQLQQFDFSEYLEVKPNTDKNVVLNEDGNYPVDEYLNNDSKPDLDDSKLNHIMKLSQSIDHFEQEVQLFINHQKATSIHFDALIKTVGYGRILSIFRILFQNGEIKLHSEYEYKIVELGFYYGLHTHIINATNYVDCPGCDDYCTLHFRYFVLCEDCRSVNVHRTMHDKSIPIEDRVCKNFTWFGKQGKILSNEFNKLLWNKIIIDDKVITKTTNLDYFAILHNTFSRQQKQKMVDNDTILNSMIKKQVEDRPFSGFSYNDEILDRKSKLLQINEKDEVFSVPLTFSSISPTSTLNSTKDDRSDSDSFFLSTLKSPLFTNDNNKSITFDEGDICPECSSEFVKTFGSLKCNCRTISTSFSKRGFSFLE